MNPTDGAGPGYEVSDARVGPLLKWGVILTVVTAGSFALMVFFAALLTAAAERGEAPPPPMMVKGVQVPPEPRLQWRPNDDFGKIRAEEDAKLDGYGWVDEHDGVARIPIERAIELLAERGLPTREAAK